MQLYKFSSRRVGCRQASQGFIQREQSIGFLLTWVGVIGQLNALEIAAVFIAPFAAGAVDQYMPHGKRCRREEVCPALPMNIHVVTDQAKISFMDERGGLQSLSGLFLIEVSRGESAEFLVHKRQELLGGLRVPSVDGVQNLRDLVHKQLK